MEGKVIDRDKLRRNFSMSQGRVIHNSPWLATVKFGKERDRNKRYDGYKIFSNWN